MKKKKTIKMILFSVKYYLRFFCQLRSFFLYTLQNLPPPHLLPLKMDLKIKKLKVKGFTNIASSLSARGKQTLKTKKGPRGKSTVIKHKGSLTKDFPDKFFNVSLYEPNNLESIDREALNHIKETMNYGEQAFAIGVVTDGMSATASIDYIQREDVKERMLRIIQKLRNEEREQKETEHMKKIFIKRKMVVQQRDRELCVTNGDNTERIKRKFGNFVTNMVLAEDDDNYDLPGRKRQVIPSDAFRYAGFTGIPVTFDTAENGDADMPAVSAHIINRSLDSVDKGKECFKYVPFMRASQAAAMSGTSFPTAAELEKAGKKRVPLSSGQQTPPATGSSLSEILNNLEEMSEILLGGLESQDAFDENYTICVPLDAIPDPGDSSRTAGMAETLKCAMKKIIP